MKRIQFRIALMRAKHVAKRALCRAVEILLAAGLKFADACRVALVFAGAK